MKIRMAWMVALLVVAGWTLEANGAEDGRRKDRKEQKEETPAPRKRVGKYERLFRGKQVETARGMVTLHRIGKKLYMELPLALLDRDFLLATTVSATGDNGDALVGQKALDPLHVRFTMVDSTLYLQEVTNPTRGGMAAEEAGVARAVAERSLLPMIESFKVAAYNADTTTVVFEVTSLLLGDEKRLSPFDPSGAATRYGQLTRTATWRKDLSYFAGMKAFEDNVSVSSVMTYKEVLTRKSTGYREEKDVTMRVTRSMLLLPEEGEMMRRRLADPRVGYFVSSEEWVSPRVDRMERRYFMHRWDVRLRDMEAWERGELVEVERPIVFYVDSMFPEAWKESVREGILVWNRAFEAIGLKGAVEARDFPVGDTTFDPDNLKYSCVRYAPIAVENSMGPSWVDPRTGEIVNASVFVYHDVVKLVNEMRFVQTAQLDPRVRTPKLPEEVMEESLRYIVAHEIGHCLGLMHNMAASAAFPVDSLRSAGFTARYGTTPSIMDYARYNYVAQPGDEGVRLTPPDLGVYDYYAIMVGYKPVPGARDEEEEREVVKSWIDARANDPMYRYGKQQVYDEYDPSALMEDLGDDAVKAGTYGIRNLKYIMAHMNEWLDGADWDYSYRQEMYDGMVNQFAGYLKNALRNVGGFYLNESFTGDARRTVAVVPKDLQRRSARFVMEQLRTAGWIDDEEVVGNLRVRTPLSERVIKLYAPMLVNTKRVSLGYYRDRDSYSPREYIDDVYAGVWASTIAGRNLTKEERLLQEEVVRAVLKRIQIPNHLEEPRRSRTRTVETLGHAGEGEMEEMEEMVNAGDVNGFGFQYYVTNISNDNQAHLWHAMLVRVQRLMESRMKGASFETRNHYGYLLEKIEDIRNWK